MLDETTPTVEWFGDAWGAAVCRECPRVPVPVGERCTRCRRRIAATDAGIVVPLYYLGGAEAIRFRRAATHLRCFVSQFVPAGAAR